MTSNLAKVVQALLAGLAVIAGAADLADLMPGVAARWFTLGVLALSTGMGVYQGQVGSMPADFRALRSTSAGPPRSGR